MDKIQIEILVGEWTQSRSILPASPVLVPIFTAMVTGPDVSSAVNQVTAHLEDLLSARDFQESEAILQKKQAEENLRNRVSEENEAANKLLTEELREAGYILLRRDGKITGVFHPEEKGPKGKSEESA